MPKQTITIAFDAECLTRQNQSGVSYYTRGLIESLATSNPDSVRLVGHYFNFMNQKKIDSLPQAANIRYVSTWLFSARFANMLRRLNIPLPFEALTRTRADYHLFPAFLGWPSMFKTPSAPMIHDTAYLDHPELVSGPARYDLSKFVPAEINRSSCILTNSDFSARRLREAYAIGSSTPIVVGHIPPVSAVNIGNKDASHILTGLSIRGNYILFVGNIEPRKNLTRLIDAYRGLDKKLRDEYILVLAGGKGWNDADIIHAISRAKQGGANIITPGYVSNQQRAALYQCASALIMVSTYEGFGMPLLEAMQYRTPILASDIPAHKETAGDAALYCNPNNTQDITTCLTRILTDKLLRQKLRKLGNARLSKFNWNSVAKEVLEAIYLTMR